MKSAAFVKKTIMILSLFGGLLAAQSASADYCDSLDKEFRLETDAYVECRVYKTNLSAEECSAIRRLHYENLISYYKKDCNSGRNALTISVMEDRIRRNE